jgi:hypothetical protein
MRIPIDPSSSILILHFEMAKGLAQGRLEKGRENRCHDYIDTLKEEVLFRQQVYPKM